MKSFEFQTEICALGFNSKHGSSASDNGLTPDRRQAIIWNNDIFTDAYMRHFNEFLKEYRYVWIHLLWSPLCMNPNLAITLPVDALAPSSARLSAATVPTEKLEMLSSNSLCHSRCMMRFRLGRRHHSRSSTCSREYHGIVKPLI